MKVVCRAAQQKAPRTSIKAMILAAWPLLGEQNARTSRIGLVIGPMPIVQRLQQLGDEGDWRGTSHKFSRPGRDLRHISRRGKETTSRARAKFDTEAPVPTHGAKPTPQQIRRDCRAIRRPFGLIGHRGARRPNHYQHRVRRRRTNLPHQRQGLYDFRELGGSACERTEAIVSALSDARLDTYLSKNVQGEM